MWWKNKLEAFNQLCRANSNTTAASTLTVFNWVFECLLH